MTKPATTTTTAIGTFENTVFLMAIAQDGDEFVTRYGPAEMLELFSDAQRRELAQTGKTIQMTKQGAVCWIDMIAAARNEFSA